MRITRRDILAALAGAVVGYFGLTVAANLENWQFYTIRSFVTGQKVMSEIIAHPADRWVVPVLMAMFLSAGSAVGVRLTRLFRPFDCGGTTTEPRRP